MHPNSVENGIVMGAQDQLDARAAHADREAKAYLLFVTEFLDAVRADPGTQVSWYDTNMALGDVVAELLADEIAIADLCCVMKRDGDVRLHLAHSYADQQVGHYIEIGAL